MDTYAIQPDDNRQTNQGPGAAGVHIVEPLNAPNLREAALAFLEGTYATRKSEEAMSLNLPTWGSFSKEVAAWCTQDFA